MSEQPVTEQTAEEGEAVWQYQLRNSKGEVIGDWSTPAEAKFSWPKHKSNDERWLKKNKRWTKIQ